MFKVVNTRRANLTPILGDPSPCTLVDIESDSGYSFGFSRYDHEDKWFLDSLVAPSGIPVQVDGEGSRCSMKKTASPEMVAVIEASLT